MNNVKIENVKYIKTGGKGDLFLADDGEYRSMVQTLSDYIYKDGDTCDVFTGGYDFEWVGVPPNNGFADVDYNYNKSLMVYVSDALGILTTISNIDITSCEKLYVDLTCARSSSNYDGTVTINIGSTVVYTIKVPGRTVINEIISIDVSSITGSHQISFNATEPKGTLYLYIYKAWFEKNEAAEIFTKSEKNKLASISASANKVANSTTNGNILIDNVETNVYTHPTGVNPHGVTKTQVGLGNVDNTSDLNKPISTATQTALNGKVDDNQVLTNVPLNAKFTDTTYGVATTSANGLMSAIDKTKINTIESNAEVNNISDVNATDLTDNGDTKLHYHTTDRSRTNHTGTQLSSTISDFASTVRSTVLTGLTITTNAVISATDTVLSAFGKLQKQITDNLSTLTSHTGNTNNPHSVTKTQVGLSNVDNTTDLNKPISTAAQTALNSKINTSQKGVANGIAQLNSNGVVPSSQLPSYVDDVLEYTSNSLFPATGESGKIYINTTTNITYRWTGSGYAEISPSIALGETSSTAYAGDKGKATTDKVNGHIADKVSHITSTERTNWNSASANKHTHTNKTVLDNTTASYTTAEKTKLSGIATGANNYAHPTNHAPSVITQDSSNRFVTDAEKASWNGKQSALGFTPYNATNPKGYITSSASITGSSNSLTSIDGDRNANTKSPSDSPKCLKLDFVTANTANGGGSFSGLMTYSPWDGTSAGGGGCSYQLLFSSTVHNGGVPYLSIRNGINSTWNTWHRLATQANIDASIDASIDAIQIGGRNLWLKSSVKDSFDGWDVFSGTKTLDSTVLLNGEQTIKFVKTSTSGGGMYRIAATKLEANTIFTYSFMLKSNVSVLVHNNSLAHMQVIGTSDRTNIHREQNMKYYPNSVPANKWTKVSVTFNTPIEAVAGETFEFRSYLWFLPANAEIYFGEFKLEKGNKATDWSPAPEDIDSAIALKADKTTSGVTSTRPIPTHIGQTHFDTTLGKPIWCKTVETPVWVDSTGTVV